MCPEGYTDARSAASNSASRERASSRRADAVFKLPTVIVFPASATSSSFEASLSTVQRITRGSCRITELSLVTVFGDVWKAIVQ